ncbi:MAG: AmmeMemoRadiSam system radical SAM enzyme [Candidatus Zophobacter franzmannii]|nr:AmmeMemoRadiSam system radical SAM enzyme [Candidatus Zophobacter franzmannii]
MHSASYYSQLPNHKVRCELCPNYCIIEEGEIAPCRSRQNIDGTLIAVNYGKTCSLSIDPIEKKPLYHYYPGSNILSLGPNSCNLHCEFCQNFEISQNESHTTFISPEELLSLCLERRIESVAFTYSEPFTWFEYLLDAGKLLHKSGIRIVLVTNGYINQEPLLELLPYIDAMNIDLKAFSNNFYQDVCQGSLKPILETIKTATRHCHIELTHLLIPDHNDDNKQFTELVDFIANLDNEIPLHIARYFPRYKLQESPTSLELMHEFFNLAKQSLKHVYLGNVPEDSITYCSNCGTTLISRSLTRIKTNYLDKGICPKCQTALRGRF